MPQHMQRLQSLFAAAVELPPERRAEMLDRECAGDAPLRAELEALLDVDASSHGTTAQPVMPELAQMLSPLAAPASLTGTRLGPYVLRAEIGRGGMGAVYRAERIDGSVTQHVAIKFVRRELLDANTLRRFQFERQVMASLNHPFIAHLLDAAQLDDGTPYYVMEYVDGVPITEYCARAGLGVRERVILMRKVCGAVAAAHRALTVHRDLKPSNILVDAAGNPKLLDFGIAKPLSAAPEPGEETGTALRYFSPQYAAPEQLGGAPAGVACDVYGLGLLLYELLAGCRPFDLGGLSAGQIERLIRDVPPAPPSSKLARGGNGHMRMREVRGDLDGIVMRCLRKSPNERYASVERLEVDLGNYLDGLPVQARGGHRLYRAQKFVRRNKAAVSAAALVVLSMLFGIVAFAMEARVARQRAAELEQVAKFESDMLGQMDPAQAGKLLSDDVRDKFDAALRKAGMPDAERAANDEVFAKLWQRVNSTDAALGLIDNTILKPAAAAIDAQFKDQPAVDATLRHILADRYAEFGLYDASVPLLERALATRRRVLGDDDPATLKSLNMLGVILSAQGKTAAAEVLLREALERRNRVLGPNHKDTLTTLDNVCMLLSDQAKWAEAEPCFRDTLEKRLAVAGNQRNTFRSMIDLGIALRGEGKFSEAERWFREALDKRREILGEDNADTISSLASLGMLLVEQGRLDEATPYLRESLVRNRRALGEGHPDLLPAIVNMGILLQAEGKLDEAETYFRDALEKSRHALGDGHATTLTCLARIGQVLQARGKFAEAEPYFREALDKRRRLLGERHQGTLLSIRDMGSLWVDQRKPGEAAALLAPLEAAMRKEFIGANTYPLAQYLLSLGRARLALGQYADAEANLREAHETFVRAPGPIANEAHGFTQALADLYAAWDVAEPGKGHGARAAEWARNANADATVPMAAAPAPHEAR